MPTPTITTQRLLLLPTPFDAKRCNYYTDGSNIVIETIPEYLTRVYAGIRDTDIVTILTPKQGYTSLGTYPISTFSTILANFDVKFYAFIGGLANGNFIEIINGSNVVKDYAILISQSEVASPTVTELYNSLGTVTVSRVGVGTYQFTSSGLFTIDKTVFPNDVQQDKQGNLYILEQINVNTVQLKTYAYTDITVLADNVLNKKYINFKIYV